MSLKNLNSLKYFKKDTLEDLIDKNDKLIKIIRKLEREKKNLKSENKTLDVAWKKTEKQYKKQIQEATLQEVFEYLESGSSILKTRKKCESCEQCTMKKLSFNGFYIYICGNCNYRKRVDEKKA